MGSQNLAFRTIDIPKGMAHEPSHHELCYLNTPMIMGILAMKRPSNVPNYPLWYCFVQDIAEIGLS